MPLKKYFASLASFDWLLFGAAVLLVCFGLAALYSVAISSDTPNFTNFQKQITFAIIGVAILFIFSFIDYRAWRDYSYVIYALAGLLLVAVIFFGHTVKGTTGWFSLFGINLQPVEIAKIALVIALSWFISSKSGAISELKNVLIAGALSGLYFVLVILQPDFGSAMILFFIWLAMIYFAGAKKKYLIIL